MTGKSMKKSKIKIEADLHVHTISSGHAYSTVEEYVKKAKEIGLKAIAITDHGPSLPGGAHPYHFSNLRMIPKVLDGIRIYKGAECNIINKIGQVDLPDDVLEDLDIVMFTFHTRTGYNSLGEEKNTKVMLRALDNPYVNVIAHPGNPMYPINVEKVGAKAKEKGIAIEINNSSFTGSRVGSKERCLEFAKEIKRLGGKVVLNSDAHMSTMLGTFSEALKIAEKAGLTEENIINTSIKKIEKELIRKR